MALSASNWLLRKRRASRGPVFVPAGDISVVSLLQVLIPLAEQIICCENPRGFHRRNAIRITQKIKALYMLFEEVRCRRFIASLCILMLQRTICYFPEHKIFVGGL